MKTNTGIKFAVAILALLGGAVAAKASPVGAFCSARLNALSAEWDAISFQPPSKASQARVVGLNGREISGGQYTIIQSRIRAAAQACRDGDANLAEQQISYTRSLLARSADFDTVQTGSIR